METNGGDRSRDNGEAMRLPRLERINGDVGSFLIGPGAASTAAAKELEAETNERDEGISGR